MSSEAQPVLTARELGVHFDETVAVEDVSLDLHAGRITAVVGESGSGKSQLGLALTRLSDGRTIGEVTLGSARISKLGEAALRHVRGRRIAYVFQDPMSALNPYLRIGMQLAEVAQTHLGLGRGAARVRAAEMLGRVSLTDTRRFLHAFPHELSGGQRQRVMIAAALMADPEVLIADEPTTALDATVQIGVLDLIATFCRTERLACLLITHDMGVVARVADEVLVMRGGRMVERGPVRRILTAPEAPYTRELIAASPRIDAGPARPAREAAHSEPLLEVQQLSVRYPTGGIFRRGAPFEAVRNLSFEVGQGETLGIVGESGSGKSSAARALLRLAPISGGRILWQGRDVTNAPEAEFLDVRRQVQMVFQDPHASMNPRIRIGDVVAEPLLTHMPEASAEERRRRVAEALEQVGLPAAISRRYPQEVSGGQAQRAIIARAIVTGPKLLICDEAVSALDVSVQARVLDLLADLQKRLGLAMLFISHDLAVVRQVSHRVLVLQGGEACETIIGADLVASKHPYTQSLLSAVLLPEPA